ncbi:formyltetrahydrofolate deformylase [Gracilimonas mengyeensis]|uniref:Formyltetrahydrofolate deformylase n=1 Tax=Gracilimonas mengyeensis TaxID=1302730 RepID=A0A521BB38_9BACT|nr:formyltetrahydrofolate deformylase [Gracilimonas mengyeensis]SMO44293.1 formyltetrahydrofolate deformylase [Gracilimonas mengyeensis]
MTSNQNTLLIACEDAKGLVHKITDVIYQFDLNIVLNREFVEHESKHFFMRTVVEGDFDQSRLVDELKKKLPANSNIRLTSPRNKNIVVMATKEHHVLGDLLIRNEFDENRANIQAVVSNHDTLRPFVERFDIPFHLVPHQDKTRKEHEQEVLEVLENYDPDYIFLAKYMRILSPDFVEQYAHKLINIHHSFLPAFIGARPYHQAFERGVKIIGATAHYVTDDLDEGPIIYQSTTPVDHRYDADQMAQAGREIESKVMAEAAKLVLDDKVFIYGNKTVILD